MYGNEGGFGRGPRRGGGLAPVKVGDEIDVKIEAVGEKGDGIAKISGFVLIVPNTKEGDEVRIRVTKVLRRLGFAEVVGKSEGGAQDEEPKEEEAEKEPEEAPAEDSEDFGEEEKKEEAEEAPKEDSEDFGEEEEKKEDKETQDEEPEAEEAPEEEEPKEEEAEKEPEEKPKEKSKGKKK